LTRTPGGNFILAESGTGAGDGQLTLLSLWGDQFSLLSNLPTAITAEGAPSGPSGVAQAHATVYIVFGSGDTIEEVVAPTQFPNSQGPASPLLSSVLRARFDPVPDSIREGFELTPAHLRSIADGQELVLENDSGERVELLLLEDFRDQERDAFQGVRPANPFAAEVAGSLNSQDLADFGLSGLTLAEANFLARLEPGSELGRRLEERSTLFVLDASMNTVLEVDVATGRSRVLARLPRLANPLFPDLGGPMTDSVPTGIHVREDGDLLVSQLSGFPFAAGSASVVRVDADTGAVTTHIAGLTVATDVLEVDGATYVLEFSTNFLANAPGRVLRFETPSSTPTVVAAGLISPSGLEHDPTRNELLVSETFTGRIVRVPLGE
jgi:hypothetical protein